MTALTLGALEAAAALIRDVPKVGLYSCRLFPGDQTTSFEAEDGEVFHLAALEFWDRLALHLAPDARGLPFRTLWGVPLVNLDLDLEARSRVMTAMLKALGADRMDRPTFYWQPSKDHRARGSHLAWLPPS